MSKIEKTSQAITQLEKIYKQLNIDKFNDELVDCIITIQSRPKSYGHVTTTKVWKTQKPTYYYELNIAAETLNRPIENTVATVLHEMVHVYHLMNGIKDTSRGNTYHNKVFKEKAESVGLIIEKDPKIGYSITSPSEELKAYIKAKKWNTIDLARVTQEKGEKTKKPSSTRKYICPCCSTSVRATKEVKIMCYDCKELMELA